MITIIIQKNYLSVEGHAGFDVKGKDIVCAAVSALACGSVEHWKNNPNFLIIQDENKPLISFSLLNENSLKEIHEFNYLISLLKKIKKHHPKFVSLILK